MCSRSNWRRKLKACWDLVLLCPVLKDAMIQISPIILAVLTFSFLTCHISLVSSVLEQIFLLFLITTKGKKKKEKEKKPPDLMLLLLLTLLTYLTLFLSFVLSTWTVHCEQCFQLSAVQIMETKSWFVLRHYHNKKGISIKCSIVKMCLFLMRDCLS